MQLENFEHFICLIFGSFELLASALGPLFTCSVIRTYITEPNFNMEST